jgi:intracellular septation protein
MLALLDFAPILLFFGAYRFWDVYVATAVLIAATVVQMGLIYAIKHSLSPMHKVTLALILIFGALTLLKHDIRILQWKFTLFYVAIALALALARWIWHKNLLKALLSMQIELPDPVWARLNLAWVGYALFMAALNTGIMYFFSTDAWMKFKVWSIAISIVFIIGQVAYMMPHLKPDEDGQKSKEKVT